MTHANSDPVQQVRAEQKARKAADKANRAVAKYEAKAQKAVDKALLRTNAIELKERVIHTRVPAALEERLKHHAERMRVPVSNLIRIILEDAVAGELDLRRLGALTAEPRGASPITVVGYQPFLPTVASVCHHCGATIGAGVSAFVGVTEPPGPRITACSPCVTAPASRPVG